jgi:hypothetical protein
LLPQPFKVVGPQVVNATLFVEMVNQQLACLEVIVERSLRQFAGIELIPLAGEKRIAERPQRAAVAARRDFRPVGPAASYFRRGRRARTGI